MTTIIAGRFDQQSIAGEALEALLDAGFSRERIATFYVNPIGLRDLPPGKSRGATESDKGVAKGAAAGGAVGLVTAPLLGPVGAITGGLVGAHIGGLIGSMSKMKEPGDTGEHAEDSENAAPIRHSGMLAAVAIDNREQEEHAVHTLRALGALDLERAEGTIADGDWTDFDPVATPALIENPPQQPRADESNQPRR